MKRMLGLLLALILAVSAAGCSVKENKAAPSGNAASTAAVITTRVPNSFKDTLPEFKFDGEITEKYDEGLRYSFSAPCSEKTFQKYLKALEKAGYKEKPTTGTGYYAATLASGMRVEAVLKDGRVTVSVKRVNIK
ncbi:MAG: hypothetical protein IKD72_02885 [Clostridia bacterium]|nr:hypothetical protein [Clostridia bacterium]